MSCVLEKRKVCLIYILTNLLIVICPTIVSLVSYCDIEVILNKTERSVQVLQQLQQLNIMNFKAHQHE